MRDAARGSFAVRREWTDLADIDESSGHPRRFAIEPLLELAALVEDLLRPRKPGKVDP